MYSLYAWLNVAKSSFAFQLQCVTLARRTNTFLANLCQRDNSVNTCSKYFDKRPHRLRTRTVQSCSTPGGANVHRHLTQVSSGPTESQSQTASLSAQLFLHSTPPSVHILYHKPPFLPSKLSLPAGVWTPPNT